MKAYHIRITGVVQGIGYRYFTRSAANRAGVSGWVRNCPDGSVELHAEGEERALRAFVENIRKGPEGLVIETFDMQETKPLFSYGFESH